MMSKRFLIGFVGLLGLLLSPCNAKADDRVVIEPFTISGYGVMNVPVMLENTSEIGAFEFSVSLPKELELVAPDAENTALDMTRCSRGMSVTWGTKTGTVVFSNSGGKYIKGNSGRVFSLPIKIKKGYENADLTTKLTVYEQRFTIPTGETEWEVPNYSIEVKIEAYKFQYEISTEPTVLEAVPGQSMALVVNLKGNYKVAGLQFDVALPDGLTMKDSDEEDFEYGSLLPSMSTSISIKEIEDEPGVYRVLIVDNSTNQIITTENPDGDLLTMNIDVAADYATESAEISVCKTVINPVPGYRFVDIADVAVPVTCEVANDERAEANQKAYDEVMATLAQLQEELDAAKAKIDEDFPNSNPSENEEKAAQEAIDAAKVAAEEELAAVAEEGTFAYTVDVEGIRKLIEAVLHNDRISGVGSLELDKVEGMRFFSVDGVELDSPARGEVVIAVDSQGKSRKVIVK